jgi:hypothetical protein
MDRLTGVAGAMNIAPDIPAFSKRIWSFFDNKFGPPFRHRIGLGNVGSSISNYNAKAAERTVVEMFISFSRSLSAL